LRVNRSKREREKFTAVKLVRLFGQAIRSWRAAIAGFDAYYPISQNRMGLLRDVVLLLPFRLARRGIVVHLHGGALDEVLRREPKWLERLVRTVIATPRTCGVVLTPNLRRCLRPLVADERIFVVANTVHAPGSPVEIPDGQLAILFLSTLMPTKGYRELVGAVARLARQGVSIRLRMAGEVWTDEDARWIADYDDVSSIEFLGPVIGEAKWSLIDECHMLVLPSTAPEGQPLTILEAMARGRPVLTTDQGGIAETVGDDAGIVLARMQGDELQSALQAELSRLASDRQRVVDMGGSARSRFENMFSPERFIESWRDAVGVER
jgi:glycosyltransferase involved in cell wall biosynthesis